MFLQLLLEDFGPNVSLIQRTLHTMFIVLQALYYERTACERSNLFRTFYYKLEEYVGDELHTKVDRKLYISLLENLIRTFFLVVIYLPNCIGPNYYGNLSENISTLGGSYIKHVDNGDGVIQMAIL